MLPLMFFSWRPIKNDSVTPYVFFMTTNKKRQCYPLYFIWQRQQCYPLWFFSWRPKKNDTVTPHVPFGENDSVTPYVLFDKYQQCYPFCFFLTRTIILFFSNMFFFMTTNELRQCYPLYFIWQRQQCDTLFFFYDDQ